MIFNVSLGIALALLARDRIRVDGVFAPPASLLLLAFLALILVPSTLYMYSAHPSWTWMYFVNPEVVPGFAILPLIFLHAGILVAGWYAGALLAVRYKTRIAIYIAGGGLAVVLLGVALFWERLTHYGTYTEFKDGRALGIMSVKLGYVLIALVAGVSASAAFLAVELNRDSRKVRSR